MTLTNICFSLFCGLLSVVWMASCGLAMDESQEALDVYMQVWTEQNMFSGTVLVAQDREILLEKAYGMADYNNVIANTCDTRFRIGSLTKAFTAMVVLQLELQGTLHTTDRLSKYVPDHTQVDDITLDMLLNHRSGVVDHTTLPDFYTHRRTDYCRLE